MIKQDKIQVVEELSSELKDATAVVVVDYKGLSVKSLQDLKKKLREVNTSLRVIKNTLFRIAAEKQNLPKEVADTVLEGPSAFVITKGDPIAPLSVLAKFAKESELPQFKVGIIDGTFQDKDGLKKLASLPSKEILLGQAVGTIASPLYGIVGVLQANIQKLLYVLQQASKK